MDQYETPAPFEQFHDRSHPLLPGEELRSITPHPLRTSTERASSTKQLLRLTKALHIDDIGKAGPSIASLPLELSEVTTPTPDHLRLYEVVFGRDSLRVAIDLIGSYPELAKTTILTLACLQGATYNTDSEEEPGRIVHEARDENDPQAQRLTHERGWHWPYYGSVDATPEFIRTLAAYTKLSEENYQFLSQTYVDKNGTERTVTYALEMALEWISKRLLQNDEGLLEFKSTLPLGIENQVWKDSWDAYHHENGELANHQKGIASIEVQVTTYDALIDAAEIFEDVFEDQTRANALRAQAHTLETAILKHFWTEDKGGYFVLGTDRANDGTLRQLKIRTSNMGHVLNSRILEGDDPEITRRRQATIQHILSPTLLCEAGVRTLASDEFRFRPGAYHNGSVWLWDTHHIAKGLRRHGAVEAADAIDARMLKVIERTNMFPEYVRGEQEDIAVNHRTVVLWDTTYKRENVVEQPPQEVQAWTVAAIRATKQRIERKSRKK